MERPGTDLGIGISDLGFAFPIRNPESHIRNRKWLRGKDSNLYLLVQSQSSCRLDDPEVIFDLRFTIFDLARVFAASTTESPLTKGRSQIENRKSQIGKETEGFEPSTLSFEARRSDSVELRLRLKNAPGRIRTFLARPSDSFTDCLPSPAGGRCFNTAIRLSNIESKRSGYTLGLPMTLA